MDLRELSGLRNGWSHKLHGFGRNGASEEVVQPDGISVGREREPPTQSFEGNHRPVRHENKRQPPSDLREQTSDRGGPYSPHEEDKQDQATDEKPSCEIRTIDSPRFQPPGT